MKSTIRLIPWCIAISIVAACGSDSGSSSSADDKYYYCQTSTEAEGGYSLVLCREYLNLSKSEINTVIAMCDKDDTGDFQEEQRCPETAERLGGCSAEEDGLDLTLWFYKDYTASEAETACSTDFDGEWATLWATGPEDDHIKL